MLGDNGFATFNNAGLRLLIQTSDVSNGGDDFLSLQAVVTTSSSAVQETMKPTRVQVTTTCWATMAASTTHIFDNLAGTPDQIIVMYTRRWRRYMRGGNDNDMIIGGTAD